MFSISYGYFIRIIIWETGGLSAYRMVMWNINGACIMVNAVDVNRECMNYTAYACIMVIFFVAATKSYDIKTCIEHLQFHSSCVVYIDEMHE